MITISSKLRVIVVKIPVDLGHFLCIMGSMKTFFIVVRELRVRAVSVTKAVVVAESAEKAVELVKAYYPPGTSGWRYNAEFVVEAEIEPNTVKMVG